MAITRYIKNYSIFIMGFVLQIIVLTVEVYAQDNGLDFIETRSVDDIHNVAVENIKEGNIKHAIHLLDQAINRVENNPELKLSDNVPTFYSNRARAKYFIGDTYGALLDADRAIQMAKKRARLRHGFRKFDSYLFFNRALCRSKLGQFKKALKDYNMAIDINPNNSDYFMNKGGVLLELGRIKEACNVLQTAINMGSKLNKRIYYRHCK